MTEPTGKDHDWTLALLFPFLFPKMQLKILSNKWFAAYNFSSSVGSFLNATSIPDANNSPNNNM